MDIAWMSIHRQDHKQLFAYPQHSILTQHHFTIAEPHPEIRPASHIVSGVDLDGEQATCIVGIYEVRNREEDLIADALKGAFVGTPGTPLDMLPLRAFLDNRGMYPCWRALVMIPRLYAKWTDPNHPSGMTQDVLGPDAQIVGPEKSEDKLQALRIVNMAIKNGATIRADGQALRYESTSNFLLDYRLKDNGRHLLRQVNMFTYPNAYRDAVEDFFVGRVPMEEMEALVAEVQGRVSGLEHRI